MPRCNHIGSLGGVIAIVSRKGGLSGRYTGHLALRVVRDRDVENFQASPQANHYAPIGCRKILLGMRTVENIGGDDKGIHVGSYEQRAEGAECTCMYGGVSLGRA